MKRLSNMKLVLYLCKPNCSYLSHLMSFFFSFHFVFAHAWSCVSAVLVICLTREKLEPTTTLRVCFGYEQVLQKVEVVETLRIENQRMRTFKVTFSFLPPDRYSDDKLLTPHQILHFMETRCVNLSVCVCVCVYVRPVQECIKTYLDFNLSPYLFYTLFGCLLSQVFPSPP